MVVYMCLAHPFLPSRHFSACVKLHLITKDDLLVKSTMDK